MVVNSVGDVSSEHVPHANGQSPFMYKGLFSHSPNLAHTGHSGSLSAHVVVDCVVVVVVVGLEVVVLVAIVDEEEVELVCGNCVVLIAIEHQPHESRQLISIYGLYLTHSLNLAHTGHS